MSSFQNSDFIIFLLTLLSIIILGVNLIKSLEERKPGHPAKYLIFWSMFYIPFFFFRKLANNFVPSLANILDVVNVIAAITFFVVLLVTLWLSAKNGYFEKQMVNRIMPILKICAIGMICCVVMFVVGLVLSK